jgi:Helix-turn-helix domain
MSAYDKWGTASDKSKPCLNLQAHREQSGIPLERIAETTGIGLHFLHAVEVEDFDKLPGGVYNTSYLRQYARAAGCSEAELLQHYYRVTAPEPSTERVPFRGRLSAWLSGESLRTSMQHLWEKYTGQHAASVSR